MHIQNYRKREKDQLSPHETCKRWQLFNSLIHIRPMTSVEFTSLVACVVYFYQRQNRKKKDNSKENGKPSKVSARVKRGWNFIYFWLFIQILSLKYLTWVDIVSSLRYDRMFYKSSFSFRYHSYDAMRITLLKFCMFFVRFPFFSPQITVLDCFWPDMESMLLTNRKLYAGWHICFCAIRVMIEVCLPCMCILYLNWVSPTRSMLWGDQWSLKCRKLILNRKFFYKLDNTIS